MRLIDQNVALDRGIKGWIIVVVTLLVAWLCYVAVEQPFRRLGLRLTSRLFPEVPSKH